jgi:serine/threonine-protein kinase
MPDLFLSYARDDQQIARRFAENLEREGFGVWWDQALNPGEAFDQVTEEALAEAKAVIVLWSKTSVSSRWVRAEATQANASNRLLPVMIEPCTRPIMFELTHTADLSQWKGDRNDPMWQGFVSSVRRFVQRREQGGSAITAAPVIEPALPRPSFGERIGAAGTALANASLSVLSLLRRIAWPLAFALAGAAIALGIAWQMRPRSQPQITRFTIDLPLMPDSFAVAPDGRRIVYSTGDRLWSRRLDQEEATPIPGGDNGVLPFFSPGGDSLGFFTSGSATNALKAFDVDSETTRVLAVFRETPPVLGGSWSDQGQIIVGRANFESLAGVSATGGAPQTLAERGDYLAVAWHDVLPGGQWVLFTGLTTPGNWSEAEIVAQNLATGERRVVLKGGHFARYLPSGHLVFARTGALYAVRFDARLVQTRGREVLVVQGVATSESNGYAPYAIGPGGTLAYIAGPPIGQNGLSRTIVKLDRRGEVAGLSDDMRAYSSPRPSPDGSKIAVEVSGGGSNRMHIWVMDVNSGVATQLTFNGDEDRYPVWSADSREIIYVSRRGKEYALWRKAADGTGEERQLLRGTDALVATDVRGQTLIFHDRGAAEERDLYAFDLAAGGEPRKLLSTPDDEASGRVSPDGNWIAYVSTPKGGGTPERRVYVRPYPNPAAGGQRAISEGQGSGPVWSADGKEIFYMVAAGQVSIMARQLATTPTTITPLGVQELFALQGRFDLSRTTTSLGYGSVYDVMPKSGALIAVLNGSAKPRDGKTGTANPADRSKMHVVLNWNQELQRLVPVK